MSHLRRLLLVSVFLIAGPLLRADRPVQLEFVPARSDAEPFTREIDAEVQDPAGQRWSVPAFYLGAGRFAVRVNAAQAGEYNLGRVWELGPEGKKTGVDLLEVVQGRAMVLKPTPLMAVRRSAQYSSRLEGSDGSDYIPVGVNLAWAEGEPVAFYRSAFAALQSAGLNWSRLWFAHWSGQNLDWPAERGRRLARGELDLGVAERWDQIVEIAESCGVRFQWVLQHHGQYSSKVDSNWNENPWNANNGGFLASPVEFFTSPEARRLTRLKYRYIVARWGYSPAVLAWELFNEVHYTDAMSDPATRASVATWHDEMAAYLRSIDVQRHLVITSLQDLRSPVYSAADYFQPHLYAANMLAGVRAIDPPASETPRPLFFGEVGDDRMLLSKAQYDSGIALVPMVWASLGGPSTYPAQIWYGTRVIETGRVGELGALAKILRRTGFAAQRGLEPFSPRVESDQRVPLVLSGGHWWERRPVADIQVAADGTEPASYAAIPRAIAGGPESVKAGFPDRVTFHVTYADRRNVVVSIADGGVKGAHARLLVDGALLAENVWPALRKEGPAPARPAELRASVSAGDHVLVLENAGGPDAFILNSVDLGLEVPALAAVGRRGSHFLIAWVWHREGVFSLTQGSAARAQLQLPGLSTGRWKLTWWNAFTGEPTKEETLTHPGGDLAIQTPPISAQSVLTLQQMCE